MVSRAARDQADPLAPAGRRFGNFVWGRTLELGRWRRMHVEPASPLTRVLQLMVSLKNRSFPVIGPDRQLVGMISREDVIRALKEATQDD